MKKTTSDAGFTLLELMISIAILGIIVVIIGAAMRLGFRSVDAGEKRMESLERLRTSLSMIDNQIQSAIPILANDKGVQKASFKGDRTSFQFTTNYSLWGGQQGYLDVTYKIESAENGRKVLTASENIIGLGGGGELKLFDPYDDIYFEYFAKDPTEEEGKWSEQWQDETNVPAKVRLHLLTGMKDFALIIPIRARGSLKQNQPLSATTFPQK